MDIDSIRYFVQDGDYRFTHEAERRMDERDVTIEQIEQVLLNGRIVQEKPKQKPYPECTVLGYADRKLTPDAEPTPWPLHVACAMGDELLIVTVYWLE